MRLQIAFFAVLTCGRCALDGSMTSKTLSQLPSDKRKLISYLSGYVSDNSTGISYRLVYQAQTWQVARDQCEREGARLAVPRTPEEFSFMQKLVRGMHYPSIINTNYTLFVWLGVNNLEDYTVWKNIDDVNIADTGFHTWAGDNGHGYSNAPEEPHCAGLDAVNPGLRDFWCHRYQPYLCQINA